MTKGLTVCPDCDESFDTVDRESSPKSSVQALKQECPECGRTDVVGIVNYPGGIYDVLGPAVDGDTCGYRVESDTAFATTKCGADADWRFHQLGSVPRGRCEEHLESHRRSALALF